MDFMEILREQTRLATDRYKQYSTFEKLLFMSELLSQESDRISDTGNKELSFKLMKMSWELSKLLEYGDIKKEIKHK